MEALKPCPFCGNKASLEYGSLLGDSYSEGWEVYSVSCLGCNGYIWDEKEADAIAAWNKRA